MQEHYLRTAFNMFDKDGNGSIDNEELVALLQGEDLSHIVCKDSIKEAIKEIDINGDGEIDFAEFIEMMKKATKND